MKQGNWRMRQIFTDSDRYAAWLRTPLGWLLVAAVGCVLAASTLAPQMWLVFAILVTLILMGVLWPFLAIWAVSCELRFDRKRCTEKRAVKVRLLITNRLWFPVWGLSLEKGFFRHGLNDVDSQTAIALARIPAAATTEFEWEYIPQSRGVYPMVEPELTCGFPFGFWFSSKTVNLSNQLIVWPETFRLGFIPPANGQSQLVSETYSDVSGTIGDRIGVRPYRAGDSLRLVRWPQSARFDELIVSEQQSPTRQLVTIVIDPRTSSEKGQDIAASAEDCLRIGASICCEFHAHGFHLRCLVNGEELRVDARASSLRQFLDDLANVKLGESKPKIPTEKFLEPGIRFIVTNAWQGSLGTWPNSNLVLIEENIAKSDPECEAWVRCASGVDLKSEFPRKWVQSCHSNWQVSG